MSFRDDHREQMKNDPTKRVIECSRCDAYGVFRHGTNVANHGWIMSDDDGFVCRACRGLKPYISVCGHCGRVMLSEQHCDACGWHMLQEPKDEEFDDTV